MCVPGLINAGCLLLNPAAGAVALCSSLFVYHFMFTSEKEVICSHLCLSVFLLSGLLKTSDEIFMKFYGTLEKGPNSN